MQFFMGRNRRPQRNKQKEMRSFTFTNVEQYNTHIVGHKTKSDSIAGFDMEAADFNIGE